MAVLIKLAKNELIYDYEIKLSAIRAQGPGGQHVNKTSSAIQLQFNVTTSSLSENKKAMILNFKDYRISAHGFITIKAQRYKSQADNKRDAIARLNALLKKAVTKPKKRVATKPSKTSIKNRLNRKTLQGKVKKLRRKPGLDE